MGESTPSFMSRVGNFFRRGNSESEPAGTQSIIGEPPTNGLARSPRPDHGTSSSLLRPWAKRDEALNNLQEGFSTLTDLMSTIKDNLGDQGRRQDELLKYLSHLPTALSSIPESHRLQNEALRAISSRLDQQNQQQMMIAEILNRVSESDKETKQHVGDIRDRLDTMAEHDRNIVSNLSNVGDAMQDVSKNSQTSAKVLEQLKDNIESRDQQLEQILHKQSVRFTSMLAIAIFLSIAALVAVFVIGYEIMQRPIAGSSTTAVSPTPAAASTP